VNFHPGVFSTTCLLANESHRHQYYFIASIVILINGDRSRLTTKIETDKIYLTIYFYSDFTNNGPGSKFLRKFLIFFVTLGLKILRL